MISRQGVLYKERRAVTSKASLLLVHGLGAHSGRWDFLSEFFLRNNFSSYSIELKGFGETEGLKGHADSLETYLNDIQILRNIIAQENPEAKIFLLGESMGGLLAFLTAGEGEGLFDGLICISPAFKGRIRFSAMEYIKIFLSFIYGPRRQFKMNFTSLMCTRDSEYQRQMDADSREHRFATGRLLVKLAQGQMKAKKLKDKIKLPLLFLLAGEDRMTDPGAAMRIFDNLNLKDKTILTYPEMHHALSIDVGREKVFSDILKWLEERL